MIDPLNTIISLTKMFFTFFLLFIFVPVRLIIFEEESRSNIDKFFICFIHVNFIVILLVHFLVFLRIYETFSLLVSLCAIIFVILWRRGKTPIAVAESLGLNLVVNLFDMTEGKSNLGKEIRIFANNKIFKCKRGLKKGIKNFFLKPVNGIFLFAVFFLAALIRFKHSITHVYLGASDSYLHLAWTKYLGFNYIYGSGLAGATDAGIYPSGYHAVISIFEKLFFIDPYVVMRFIGPIGGFMIVLSLYYIMSRNASNPYSVWVALFIYIFCIGAGGLPSDVWRQMMALPQEYSIIFFLPGIHFFNMYLRYKKNTYLILVLECVALTVLIHPYITLFLILGIASTALIHLRSFFKKEVFLKTMGGIVGAVVLGLLPLGVGRLVLKAPWHRSFAYGASFIKLPSKLRDFVTRSFDVVWVLPILSVLIIVVIVIIFLFIKISRTEYTVKESEMSRILLILSMITSFMYVAPELGIPMPMDVNRIGIFFSLVFAALAGMSLNSVDRLLKKEGLRNKVKAVLCCFVVLVVFGFLDYPSPASFYNDYIPEGAQYEYDESVYLYQKIKNDYPALEWTIISPVEQYSQVYGFGRHYELWELAKAVSGGTEEEIRFPTKYVFIFVEKNPLYSDGRPIQKADAKKDFPAEPPLLDDYYKRPDYRHLIEAKVYFWAEEYMKSNDEMKVYFENEKMKIYMLEQDPNDPVNLVEDI